MFNVKLFRNIKCYEIKEDARVLVLEDITKVYRSGDEMVEALKGVSIKFRKSEFVSILGQSGCGKTTLLNIIGGLDRYTRGDLIINRKVYLVF